MRRTLWATGLTLLCLGCRNQAPPTSQPADETQAKPPDKPTVTLLAPESAQWSRDEACAQLGADNLGLSAAVRLVRLAGVTPLCLPTNLTDAWLRRLKLSKLNAECWALGLTDPNDGNRLRAPVLVKTSGDVELLAEGPEEELLVLHLSADPDVFPHLATTPDRVVLLGTHATDAIILMPEQRVWFELRRQDIYSYIGLILPQGDATTEVARYTWDPYERAFAGPATDKLPDPPGGYFEVDLDESLRFVPMGGEIPEPEPDEPHEPQAPSPPSEALPV